MKEIFSKLRVFHTSFDLPQGIEADLLFAFYEWVGSPLDPRDTEADVFEMLWLNIF